jgi:hypothetical protein
VADTTDPVNVTPVWGDAAAGAISEKRSRKLVNDLDFEFVPSDGTIILLWQIGHRAFDCATG